MAEKIDIVVSAKDQASAQFAKVENSAQGLKGSVIGMAAGFGVANVAMGVANIALSSLKDAFSYAIESAEYFNKAFLGLATVSKAFGESAEASKKAAIELSRDGLMSVAEAAEGLKNLIPRMGLEDSIKVMKGLKDAAAFNRQGTLEYGQAIVGATQGIKNLNSMMVDNAGVTKNVDKIMASYGYRMQDLDDAEKKAGATIALVNGLLKETKVFAGDAERAAGTLSGKQSQLGVATKEAAASFGKLLMPTMERLVGTATAAAQSMKGFADSLKTDSLDDYITRLKELGVNLNITTNLESMVKLRKLNEDRIEIERKLNEYEQKRGITRPNEIKMQEMLNESVSKEGKFIEEIATKQTNLNTAFDDWSKRNSEAATKWVADGKDALSYYDAQLYKEGLLLGSKKADILEEEKELSNFRKRSTQEQEYITLLAKQHGNLEQIKKLEEIIAKIKAGSYKPPEAIKSTEIADTNKKVKINYELEEDIKNLGLQESVAQWKAWGEDLKTIYARVKEYKQDADKILGKQITPTLQTGELAGQVKNESDLLELSLSARYDYFANLNNILKTPIDYSTQSAQSTIALTDAKRIDDLSLEEKNNYFDELDKIYKKSEIVFKQYAENKNKISVRDEWLQKLAIESDELLKNEKAIKAFLEAKDKDFEESMKRNHEKWNKEAEDFDKKTEKYKDQAHKFAEIGAELGEAFGKNTAEALLKGKPVLKEAMKEMLGLLITYLEKKYLAVQANAILEALMSYGTMSWAAVAKVAAGYAALEGARVAINNFQQGTSYVKQSGAATLHQGERVLSNIDNSALIGMLGEISNKLGYSKANQLYDSVALDSIDRSMQKMSNANKVSGNADTFKLLNSMNSKIDRTLLLTKNAVDFTSFNATKKVMDNFQAGAAYIKKSGDYGLHQGERVFSNIDNSDIISRLADISNRFNKLNYTNTITVAESVLDKKNIVPKVDNAELVKMLAEISRKLDNPKAGDTYNVNAIDAGSFRQYMRRTGYAVMEEDKQRGRLNI